MATDLVLSRYNEPYLGNRAVNIRELPNLGSQGTRSEIEAQEDHDVAHASLHLSVPIENQNLAWTKRERVVVYHNIGEWKRIHCASWSFEAKFPEIIIPVI